MPNDFYGRPKFTPRGDRVMYHDGSVKIISLQGGFVRLLSSSNRGDFNSHVSPDGTQIVFYSRRNGPDDIYLMDANGRNRVQLRSDGSFEFGPEFSPDGQTIVFTWQPAGTRGVDIYLMATDGFDVRLLVDSGAVDRYPAFSPDGGRVAFECGGVICIVNDDGTGPARLTASLAGTTVDPDFSPDGTRIGFASNHGGTFDLYTVGIDGNDVQQVTDDAGDNTQPNFSPDGRSIAFISERDDEKHVNLIGVEP